MKIAQVIPFFAPAWSYGGPVKVCFDLSRELISHRNEVTVLTTDAYDHLRRMNKVCEEMDGVKVVRFRNISNNLAKRSNLYLPKGFKKYFQNHVKDYDIVHLHAFYTYQNIIASKYCVKYGVPYILHLHEKFDATREMGKSRIKKLFLTLFGKNIITNAKKILVLSQGEKLNLLKFDRALENKIEIVPNPAPVYLGRCSDKLILRKKYNLSQSNKVILSLSRLNHIKGIDLLIKAFSSLVKKDGEFRLIIAGPDERGHKSQLKQIIKDKNIQDKVIFAGLADQKMKNELFCISDILALFSRYESFGVVVLESLAHAVPVCLSKNVGIAKEIYAKKCAVIISNPCDSQTSALALDKAFELRFKLAKNCKTAVAGFSLEKITDQIVSIYKVIT